MPVSDSQQDDGNFTKNGRIFDEALRGEPHFALKGERLGLMGEG